MPDIPQAPLLVHACCGACLAALLEPLRARGAMFTAFFHNPNIHPLLEFRRRLKATQVLSEAERVPLVADAAYGLERFLDAIGPHRAAPERCRICYRLRLDATARYALEHGFPRFTSTLLASPQQDHQAVCQVGHEAARRHGVAFEDTDFRPHYERGQALARRRQLYRQQYCGCIFSEFERYKDTTVHLHRGGQGAEPRDAARESSQRTRPQP